SSDLAAGLSVEVPAPERNADRRRPDGDADAEYTIKNDPRQLHIPAASLGSAYDKRAMQFCSDLVALVEKLNDADRPDPSAAMDSWMAGRGDGPSPDEVQSAADWMVEFAALYRTHEPQRPTGLGGHA
ncbi:MAG: hypothetical protein ACJ8H8_30880, partial [Geminicoccaceae bacterium]